MSQRIREQIREDMVRLRGLLGRVLAIGDGLGAEPSGDHPARVLDLACGECHEAETLTSLLSELRAGTGGRVALTGVDVRAREIENARRRLLREAESGHSYEFLTSDASRLQDHKEMGDDYDLVFLRHQNYWNGERVWAEIFDQALDKMHDDGRLVITSYFDREHQLALDAIQRLGGELIRTEFNPQTRLLSTPGKSVDRHVAVFRKK